VQLNNAISLPIREGNTLRYPGLSCRDKLRTANLNQYYSETTGVLLSCVEVPAA